MIAQVLQRARGFVDAVFPERQIYHRSKGEVRYIALTTRQQLAAVGALTLVLIWFLYASASVFLSGHLLSSQSRQAFAARMHYQRLIAEARAKQASTQALLDGRTKAFASAADEFENRLQTLKLLLEQREGADPDEALPAGKGASRLMISAVAEDQTPRRSRTPDDGALDAAGKVRDPLKRMAILHRQEDEILQRAEEQTETRLEGLKAVLSMTGLGLDDILAQDTTKAGGPLIALKESQVFADALSLDPGFAQRVTRLAERIGEADRMGEMVHEIPLGSPLLVEHRRTSGFGTRIDPITHRVAHHSGQDFGAFRLAPIVATAPGTVVYAGWRAGYGRLVEIDHGMGFRTRYGHMAKIKVKRGQKVRAGQQIGAMGSSGRSTGVHLHYEVWFKGRPYDPQKFLKAGLYVQNG